jgi:hypothetical protein
MDLTDSLKALFIETARSLKGSARRLFMARTVRELGAGGQRLAERELGWNRQLIRKGMHELEGSVICLDIDAAKRHRGRLRVETKYPDLKKALEDILDTETAGNPMKDQKWVRSSLAQLALKLKEQNIDVSGATVSRVLKDMGYSMKVNIKKRKGFGWNSPDRDEQFKYIASMRRKFSGTGNPIISVDTKKKELIGDFKKSGKTWRKEALEVNEYDFPSLAICRAIPYGIYDVTKNQGYVYVGTSGDTPEFATDVIARWWKEEGATVYLGIDNLLILADGGGSNGYRVRAWKQQLQEKVCDKFGLTVTVCHYPTRCSKWNPIEHRLFSQISLNWAGKPLRTLEITLAYIRGTSTSTGLTVKSFLQEGIYETGQKVSRNDMKRLNLENHTTCPDWNYTIRPRFPPSSEELAIEDRLGEAR